MSKSTAEAGRLVLVVGPSGVGKDTLIDGARAALRDDPAVVFARREITRPAEAGGEDHQPVDWDTFRARRAAGGYILSWEANGLGYGLPAALEAELAAGRIVVANGSRGVLPEAQARFPRLRVAWVTAAPEIVAARLVARGREGAAEIAARLQRMDLVPVTGDDVAVIRNDGDAADGIAALAAAIRR